jgi:hypothetical protein
LYVTKNADDGTVLDGETFLHMRNKLRAKILSNEADQVAAIFGLPIATPAIVRAVRACRYPKPLGQLVALIMLAFATTTLQAQIPTPTQQQELNKAVRPASNLETYRQPVITCTVGRTGFLNAARQAATIEMVVALGVAYIVLGGVIFALVASFRLLSDKVDSFFALLVPEPTGTRGLRTILPLDEDFSPFKFEPSAKQEARQRLRPRQRSQSAATRGSTTVPASQADRFRANRQPFRRLHYRHAELAADLMREPPAARPISDRGRLIHRRRRQS